MILVCREKQTLQYFVFHSKTFFSPNACVERVEHVELFRPVGNNSSSQIFGFHRKHHVLFLVEERTKSEEKRRERLLAVKNIILMMVAFLFGQRASLSDGASRPVMHKEQPTK